VKGELATIRPRGKGRSIGISIEIGIDSDTYPKDKEVYKRKNTI